MALISVIICLLLERFLSSLHTIRNYRWLESFASKAVEGKSARSEVKSYGLLAFILVTVPVAVAIIDAQLKYLFAPLQLLFSTIVLFYAIGPETFYDRLKSFCDAKQNNDHDSAIWFAEKILRRQTSQTERDSLPMTLIQNLFPIVNDRIFAPVFWFIVLGAPGAILYRICSRLHFYYQAGQHQDWVISKQVSWLLSVLSWIPTRMSAFGYMLVGNFMESMRYCKQSKSPGFFVFSLTDSNQLLSCIASGAIGLPSAPEDIGPNHLKNALGIVRRNIELSLGALAILTLSGTL